MLNRYLLWKSRYQGTNFCQASLGNVSRSWQKFASWHLLFHIASVTSYKFFQKTINSCFCRCIKQCQLFTGAQLYIESRSNTIIYQILTRYKMDLSQVHHTLSMISWIISCLILMPIEILWLLQFWSRRRYLFVSTRRPKLLLKALIYYWISEFMYWSMLTLDWDSLLSTDGKQFWKNGVFYSWFVQNAVGTGFFAINLSRWWLSYFS